ncbi:MAG: LysR family transcriptional regulator [Burkholderiaceae bacterium]|jgi:DNA-binding transcriptional LysR family regulator|nr:LysR family transcriptional regulator [Burkholderiaceae bacterium]
MTLQQILDALAVAEHGNLHAAARATGQTQPALTKSLRRLEMALGTALFDRHARGMRLTPIGRRFLDHARRIVGETERARATVAQLLGERLGRVVYGISVAPSILLAPGAIERYRRQFPQVELHSRSGLYQTLAPRLRDGEIHFAICPRPIGPLDPLFDARPLIRSEMVVVARSGHPRAGAKHLSELAQCPIVIGAPGGQPGGGLVTVFEHAGLQPPTVVLRTDGLIDTLAMVAGSDCLAMLPMALVRSGLVRERLIALQLVEPLPVYEVLLLQRRDVPPMPAAEALARQFVREASYLRSAPGRDTDR